MVEIEQSNSDKRGDNSKHTLILSVLLLLSGIAFIWNGVFFHETTPPEDFRLEPTAVALAMLDLQATGYPGPVPTQPPQPGEPTPPPLRLLREALKWTPYETGVTYVLYDGNTVYVGFEVSESIYPGVTEENTGGRVRAILHVLAQTNVPYKRVVLISSGYNPPNGNEPVNLAYDGDVVRRVDWLAFTSLAKVYDLAESKRVEPPFDKDPTPGPISFPFYDDPILFPNENPTPVPTLAP